MGVDTQPGSFSMFNLRWMPWNFLDHVDIRGGDTYLKKGYRDILFFTCPQPLHKTPFSTIFSYTRPRFNPKSQNFPILFKMLKFGNFPVSNPTHWPKNLVQEASFGPKQHCCQKIISASPTFGADPFYKPPFLTLWAAHPSKMKIEYPHPQPPGYRWDLIYCRHKLIFKFIFKDLFFTVTLT